MIVGLTGYAQSGKDSTAAALGFTRVAFADALKEVVLEMDPWVASSVGMHRPLSDFVEMHGWEWTKQNTDARDYLIALGDGARRHISPTVWIDAVKQKINHLVDNGRDVAITDVRYANEAELIIHMGGEIWLVQREEAGPANSTESDSIDRLLLRPGANRVISNDGTLDDLRAKIDSLMTR